MDWDALILEILRAHGAGLAHDLVPWQPLVAYCRELSPEQAEAFKGALLRMIDLDYRNPHSEQPYAGDGLELLPLPAGMRPEDLLCLEAAAYAATELGLEAARPRVQELLRAARFHAIYPHLRRLHLDLPDLVRRMERLQP